MVTAAAAASGRSYLYRHHFLAGGLHKYSEKPLNCSRSVAACCCRFYMAGVRAAARGDGDGYTGLDDVCCMVVNGPRLCGHSTALEHM